MPPKYVKRVDFAELNGRSSGATVVVVPLQFYPGLDRRCQAPIQATCIDLSIEDTAVAPQGTQQEQAWPRCLRGSVWCAWLCGLTLLC
jgi:hypothetical protein